MAVNMDGAIAYAKRFVGKVPYSMTGPRDPERGTADCSSFVYWAVVRGGGGKTMAICLGAFYGNDASMVIRQRL